MQHLGTGNQRHNKANPFQIGSNVQLQDGKNIYRILNGPFAFRMAFFPAKAYDQSKQAMVSKRIPFIVKDNSIFDRIANLDKSYRINILKEDAKDVRSPFFPVSKFGYVVFDRRKDAEEGTIKKRFLTVPKSVFTQLKDLQTEEHVTKAGFMAESFLFMWDVNINRGYSNNPAMKNAPGGGAKYTCKFLPDNKWAGKLPMSCLELTEDQLFDKLNETNALQEKIFTPDEWTALNDADFNLDSHITPLSDEKLAEQLSRFELNLSFKTGDGNYLFPNEIREPLLSDIKSMKLLPETNLTPIDKADDTPKETNVVDDTVVENTEAPESADFDFASIDDDDAGKKKQVNNEEDDLPF